MAIDKSCESYKGFCLGDRVVVIADRNERRGNYKNPYVIPGLCGTVRAFYRISDYYDIGIEFDKNIKGHDINGECQYGLGYWLCPEHIEHVEEEISFDSVPSLFDIIGGAAM